MIQKIKSIKKLIAIAIIATGLTIAADSLDIDRSLGWFISDFDTFPRDFLLCNKSSIGFGNRLSLNDMTISKIDYFLNLSNLSNLNDFSTEVCVHSNLASQIIAEASQQTKPQSVGKIGRWLWILGWLFIGGGLSLIWFQTDLWQKSFLNSIKLPIISTIALIATLFASSQILFLFGWRLPTFWALLASIVANFSVTGYYYQSQKKIAFTDPLTKIANRRFCDRYLERQWSKSQREKTDLAIILCEVDCFEEYNNIYGQSQANICLQKIALLLSGSIRNDDFTARYDCTKFIVILPDSNVKTAIIVAERIRAKLKKNHTFHQELKAGEHISISMGIASLDCNDIVATQQLLDTAELALDRAKEAGGDRVVVSDLKNK